MISKLKQQWWSFGLSGRNGDRISNGGNNDKEKILETGKNRFNFEVPLKGQEEWGPRKHVECCGCENQTAFQEQDDSPGEGEELKVYVKWIK